jgi:hypothetical protein
MVLQAGSTYLKDLGRTTLPKHPPTILDNFVRQVPLPSISMKTHLLVSILISFIRTTYSLGYPHG